MIVKLSPRDHSPLLQGLFAEDLGADACISGRHRVKVRLGQYDYELYFHPDELLPVEGKRCAD
ncbi:MAG: hypothetical protein WC869_10445 [Phycisphaerae bacterium]|jgi:hypothetical protein